MRSNRLSNFQLADWLPAGVALDDVITLLAALAVLTTVLAMWQVLRPSTSFERRLEQIVQRKESMRQQLLAARRSGRGLAAVGLMREAVTL